MIRVEIHPFTNRRFVGKGSLIPYYVPYGAKAIRKIKNKAKSIEYVGAGDFLAVFNVYLPSLRLFVFVKQLRKRGWGKEDDYVFIQIFD